MRVDGVCTSDRECAPLLISQLFIVVTKRALERTSQLSSRIRQGVLHVNLLIPNGPLLLPLGERDTQCLGSRLCVPSPAVNIRKGFGHTQAVINLPKTKQCLAKEEQRAVLQQRSSCWQSVHTQTSIGLQLPVMWSA
eukprot:scaffold68886_cov13-Tisochrysis_lutea.AAC.1